MSAASAKAPVVIVRVGPSGSPERRRRQPSFTSSPPTTPTFTAGTANGSTVFGENELLPGLSEPLLPPRAYAGSGQRSVVVFLFDHEELGKHGKPWTPASHCVRSAWPPLDFSGGGWAQDGRSRFEDAHFYETHRAWRGAASPPGVSAVECRSSRRRILAARAAAQAAPSTTAALAALSTVGDGGSATPRDNNAALMRALTGQVGGSGCRGALVRKEDALLRGHLTCGKTSSPPSVSGGAGGSVAQSSGGATISGRLGKVLAAAGGGATSWGTYYRRGTLAWVDSASPQIVLFTSTMSRGALLKQNENLASVMPFAEVVDDDGNPDAWASLDALSSLPGERSDGRLGALKPTLRLALSAPVARGK